MRKLDVTNYNVIVTTAGGKTSAPYDVKASLITCLLHPTLKLHAGEVLIRHKIGEKILAAEKSVLLEEDEYSRLKSAFDTIEGFGQNDVELIQRVFNAETVPVKEAK